MVEQADVAQRKQTSVDLMIRFTDHLFMEPTEDTDEMWVSRHGLIKYEKVTLQNYKTLCNKALPYLKGIVKLEGGLKKKNKNFEV